MRTPSDPWGIHDDEDDLEIGGLGPAVRPLDASQAEAVRRVARPHMRKAVRAMGQRGLLAGLAVGAVLVVIILWALS